MRKIAFLTACLLAVCASASHAVLTSEDLPNRTGVKFDRVVAHAAFKVQEQFDQNIFLTASDRKYDFITLLNPSVGLAVPIGDNAVSVEYDCGINFFANYNKQDHIDHRVRGLIEINWTDYKITVRDTFRRFTDRSGTELTARMKQATNNLRAGVAAQFDQLAFDVGYVNRIHSYLNREIDYASLSYNDKSFMTNMVELEGSYRFMPKTEVLVECDLGMNHYMYSSIPPDSYFVEALAGLRGRLWRALVANLKAGFRYQKYDKSNIFSDKPFIGPVIRGGLDYTFTKDDIIRMSLERVNFESTYNNMNYYTINHVGLKYSHRFNRKVAGDLFGMYQFNQYPSVSTENGVTARRYDNLVYLGCGLRYDLRKWIAFEAKYEYKQRASRFDNLNYYDNLVTLNGTVGF